MSDFGIATLDLSGKAGFRPLFQEPVPKSDILELPQMFKYALKLPMIEGIL
jgi:hypothetical protein